MATHARALMITRPVPRATSRDIALVTWRPHVGTPMQSECFENQFIGPIRGDEGDEG